MTPEAVKNGYRRMLDEVGEYVLIRRYTGSGQNRPWFEAEVKARVTGYEASDLTGDIKQGDRRLIVLAQDLIDRQFALPVRKGDKAIVRGRELNIEESDDSTRRVAGVLVAYEMRARG